VTFPIAARWKKEKRRSSAPKSDSSVNCIQKRVDTRRKKRRPRWEKFQKGPLRTR